MTMRHLEIFIAVADLGTMTGAAKALYIAQPTVSQAISELEVYYGVKLFERLSRRLYITEQGRKLLSYARHITDLLIEMKQAMDNDDNHGILKVGATITIGTSLLTKFVSQFTQNYPQLQIKATIKNTKDIQNMIITNNIDFALVEGTIHTSEIITTPFMEDYLVLVCGKKHPLYKTKTISITELSKHNFIVREQESGTRELFETVMETNNAMWNLSWECNTSDALINAAIDGIGVAVISQKLIKNQIQSEDLFIINVHGLEFKREFSIAYHKNKFLTEPMKEFFNLCYRKY